MKMNILRNRWARQLRLWAGSLTLCGLALATAHAQTTIQWGLTLTNINNPTPTTVVTNADGSISITTGGGDTYGNPDSFAYAYQQVTGDFDIRVQIINCTCLNTNEEVSPKASLMVRGSLDPDSYDFMINALPLATSREGQIESIGRLNKGTDTDDIPGRNYQFGGYAGTISAGSAASDTWSPIYGGDTTTNYVATYPDLWLRIQRQGSKFMSYYASDNNTNDIPQDGNPGSTNGWQLLVCAAATTDFGPTVYIGLSTVAHNSDINDSTDTVTSVYANYGPTPLINGSASIPTTNGVPVDPSMGPGAFPTKVIAANFDVSLDTNSDDVVGGFSQGYPGNILQTNQGAPSSIIWDSGGYASVSRDIIADIAAESTLGFASARYQCSGFDFTICPNDAVLATNNLGSYSNPNRDRYSSGDPTVPACQSWNSSPNYGFSWSTIHKTGASWPDGTPSFFAATYMQLDPSSSSYSFDMIGGHFINNQAYTRTTKLVVGESIPGPDGEGSNGNPYRCAISHSIAYFPYSQGWKSGYFDEVNFSQGLNNFNRGGYVIPAGIPMWKHGDGWGLWSGHALDGCTNGTGNTNYDSPQEIMTWLDASNSVYDGLALVSFPGVNSQTDGMLFTIADNENNGLKGPFANNAALPNGNGWYVAVRDIVTGTADPTVYATDGTSDAGTSFSFIYIPYNAQNLIGGHISGTNGATIKGAGNYTISRLSTGRYALTIPGKTDTNGMLMLINSGYMSNQPSGFTNIVDTSFMSYEYGGTNVPADAFIISSVYVNTNGGGEGVVNFRDADFNFVWVDFANPLSPGSTTPVQPSLSVTSFTSTNLTISWSNGPGFILQSTPSLSNPTWTPVSTGTNNPAVIPILPTGSQFFRVVQ
jgi:hypothetical protein